MIIMNKDIATKYDKQQLEQIQFLSYKWTQIKIEMICIFEKHKKEMYKILWKTKSVNGSLFVVQCLYLIRLESVWFI